MTPDDDCDDLNKHYRITRIRQRGLIIQSEPSHWRWNALHHPKRCLLCWAERLAVRLHLAHYEED